jgi:Zn-dependent peptidase ImmA (M78 family)
MDTHIITEKNIFHLALLLNVPGEAIVNRLFEINVITGNMRKKFLSIPDKPKPNTLV